MRFRGREMAHGELGMAVLRRVQEQTAEMAKIEAHPRMEGRQMLMVLAPKVGDRHPQRLLTLLLPNCCSGAALLSLPLTQSLPLSSVRD